MRRVDADDEVLVRTVREHARGRRQGLAGGVWKIPLDCHPQYLEVARVNLPVQRVGIYPFLQVVVATDLEAGHAVLREAVVVPLVDLEVEDRKALRREKLRPVRLEPG